jgi:hypothetical protein
MQTILAILVPQGAGGYVSKTPLQALKKTGEKAFFLGDGFASFRGLMLTLFIAFATSVSSAVVFSSASASAFILLAKLHIHKFLGGFLVDFLGVAHGIT